MGVLCIIGCSVQLISEVFWDCIFASLWGACLRFASLWRANSLGDSGALGAHLSNVCWGLLFCLQKAYALHCLLNLSKRSSFKSLPLILLWIKPSTHIFQHGSSLFLENVCDSCCMHQTALSGSAAFVPQCKFTELCSSAFVVLQSKSTELRSSAEVGCRCATK